MASKFFETFLSAGLTKELTPCGFKKNLLCSIKNLALFRGDLDRLKEKLLALEDGEAFLKWVRFLTLSEERRVYLAINYSHPFKNSATQAVYDIELVRTAKSTPSVQVKPGKGVVICTVEEEQVCKASDLFECGAAHVQDISDLFDAQPEYDYYLAKDIKLVDASSQALNPLNELRLFQIQSGQSSIKMPSGYRMASSTLFKVDGCSSYLLKRQRADPSTFRFTAELIDCYPALSEGAAMNTLKMVFPEGVELSTKPRRPAYKSCYIAIRDDSLEKHMLSFVLFSEQLSAEGVEAYNLNNFKLAKEVYADRAVGLVSKHHDNYTAEKVLRYILEYVSRDAVDTPVERVICNLIDEVLVKVDHVTLFSPLPDLLAPNKPCAPVRIVSTPRMPNISVSGLKKLFRVMSIESILVMFKNILLERGVYIVGRNSRSAYDIIESMTGLIYPLKWELPRILSYEADYKFFESPVPMIYFFQAEKFALDNLAQMDLRDKAIFCLDTDSVIEYCAEPGLGELPPKLAARLEKSLEKLAGTYNKEYLAKKSQLSREEFDRLVEREDDSLQFDYWKIRESFFEAVLDLLHDYQRCFRENKMLAGSLSSEELFDFQKFVKSKSHLKHKNFLSSFTKTSLLSRFIECRMLPEDSLQTIYYSHFDHLVALKASSSKQETLQRHLGIVESNPVLEPLPPNTLGLDLSGATFSYCGVFPQLNAGLFVEPRQSFGQCELFVVEDWLSFLDESTVAKMSEEKWARTNLEILYTVWFISLKVFLSRKVLPSSINLVTLAYDKFIEMESEKIHANLQIVKAMAYMLGIFREVKKFQRIFHKSSALIEEKGHILAVYSEYVRGLQVQLQPVDLTLKLVKYSSSRKQSEQSGEQPESAQLTQEEEEKRDELIPVSVKSHFETNAFCVKCGTYIPEEIILARILKDSKKTRAVCPNQACQYEYEPVFNVMFLKEKGSNKMPTPTKLHSPLRLFLLLRDFLHSHDARDLFDDGLAKDLYWNVLFYATFLNVPCFFMQKQLNEHMLDHGLSYTIPIYTFDQVHYSKSGSKTTLNHSGHNESSISPDKSANNSGSHEHAQSAETTKPKFSFKKDFYKRLEGYEDKIKKGTPLGVLKIYFKYCEEMRNFEKKYDHFRSYLQQLAL